MVARNRDQFSQSINWQRFLIAFLTILLAVMGLAVHWIPGIDDGSRTFIAGTAWKIALVLAIAWLASPQLERMGWHRVRGTMLVAITIVIVLYAIRPRIGAIAALLLAGGSLLVAVTSWVRKLAGHRS